MLNLTITYGNAIKQLCYYFSSMRLAKKQNKTNKTLMVSTIVKGIKKRFPVCWSINCNSCWQFMTHASSTWKESFRSVICVGCGGCEPLFSSLLLYPSPWLSDPLSPFTAVGGCMFPFPYGFVHVTW